MIRIYLVRHGKAAAGFGTHVDPGLDETGIEQARRVADQLTSLDPMPIYSSPLARAQETAAPLASRWQTDVVLEPRVAEVPSPTSDLEARAAWLAQAMQGTWQDLGQRWIDWRDTLAACLAEQTRDCVMFSHYVAINAAVGAATGDDRMRIFSPDNCSVTILTSDAGTLGVAELGASAITRVN